MIEFKKFTDFPRGTLYDILADAYAYDDRNRQIWDENWKETDDFFYDNPEIADKYSLVTCLDGDKIAKIEVLSHNETAGVSDPAFAAIPDAIIAANSTEIDTVTGATKTSEALIAAVNDALAQIQK